jgi:hypothetical protein
MNGFSGQIQSYNKQSGHYTVAQTMIVSLLAFFLIIWTVATGYQKVYDKFISRKDVVVVTIPNFWGSGKATDRPIY